MTNDAYAESQSSRSRLRCLQDIRSALSALDRFIWRRRQGLSFRDLIPVVEAMATAQENTGWDCDAQIHADKRKQAIQEFIRALEHFLAGEDYVCIDLSAKASESERSEFDLRWNAILDNPSFSERRMEIGMLLSDIHLKSPWRKKVRDLRDGKLTFEEAISDLDVRHVLSWAAVLAGIRPKHDPHWLHYLKDNPVALRTTVEQALNYRGLKEQGRRSDPHLTAFIVRVSDIYLDLTGQKLTYGTTVRSGSAPDAGEEVPGPSLTFAKTCLNVVAPGISRDQARYRVRQIGKTKNQ